MRNYTERMISSLADYAEVNIGTYLDEISSEMADGITLNAFKAFRIGEADPFNTQYGYPLMIFVPVLGERETGRGFENIEVSLAVDVGITLEDTDSARLVKKQGRYVDAYGNMITANPDLGGAVFTARLGRIDFYTASDENRLLNLAIIRTNLVRYGDE